MATYSEPEKLESDGMLYRGAADRMKMPAALIENFAMHRAVPLDPARGRAATEALPV